MSKKNIAILGSTGSIGQQALEVVSEFPDNFGVVLLAAAGNSLELLIQQAKTFSPKYIVVILEQFYQPLKEALSSQSTKVFRGMEVLEELVQDPDIDLVLNAIVGSAGLGPTCNAICAGKDIALANKETLVVAGELVMALAKEHQVKMLPVDSEHSAIFQCLVGEEQNQVEKIILTASGGPFRGKTSAELSSVTKAQALKHPNWSMGAKITIDSASLMNKGLEVIEAKWLFDLRADQIDVVVHPQSIVHSLVQFEDGSIKAQLGLPDMKLPIQYAMSFPQRTKNSFERFDFLKYPNLTFEKPDMETFRNLKLAYQALEAGGNMPCVLNAANEVAVQAFLDERIGFLQLSQVIEETMCQISTQKLSSLEDYIACDQQSRRVARDLVDGYIARAIS